MATAVVGIRVDEATKTHLEMEAERRQTSVSEMLKPLVEGFLNHEPTPEPEPQPPVNDELEQLVKLVRADIADLHEDLAKLRKEDLAKLQKPAPAQRSDSTHITALRTELLQELASARADIVAHRSHFRTAVAAILTVAGHGTGAMTKDQADAFVRKHLMPK